jgi:hypothetical protein
MNSRGGTLYLRCHPEHAGFFGKLGFSEASEADVPAAVRDRLGAPRAGHESVFMKAR